MQEIEIKLLERVNELLRREMKLMQRESTAVRSDKIKLSELLNEFTGEFIISVFKTHTK